MSLEARVTKLEQRQAAMEVAIKDLVKVVAGTHEIVVLILKEQMELRKELVDFKQETRENFKEVRENFKQLEMLIRQTHSNH